MSNYDYEVFVARDLPWDADKRRMESLSKRIDKLEEGYKVSDFDDDDDRMNEASMSNAYRNLRSIEESEAYQQVTQAIISIQQYLDRPYRDEFRKDSVRQALREIVDPPFRFPEEPGAKFHGRFSDGNFRTFETFVGGNGAMYRDEWGVWWSKEEVEEEISDLEQGDLY